MKKIICLAVAVIMLVCGVMNLSSCSKDDRTKTIGIIQFGSHGSLTNCYEGILKGLMENGIDLDSGEYKVELLNSNFDGTVSQTQANTLANKGVSMIIGIATPSAIAAANAVDGTDIPVVFCAVTDASVMKNYENVTGVSDIPNFEKQLELVTAYMNKTDLSIGVLYSSEESSSPIQVENLKKAAEKYEGMIINDSLVSDITTIDTKVNELVSKGVDCFINLLDNTIVGKLETNILPITNEKNIPVFGSEIEQVKVGCLASASIDYLDNVGYETGKIASEILLGNKAAKDIAYVKITNPTNYYNSKVANKLGISVPSTPAATDVNN